ncbi:MAG: hypothetical protein Q9207_003955 [Kuettlingeria erythrocarpa]
MNPSGDPNANQWPYQGPSRPSSNFSYNPYGPSNSNSPAHGNTPAQGNTPAGGNTPVPQHPPSYGGIPYNQMNERQRRIYDIAYQNQQNASSHPAMNGGGHHNYSQYSGNTQYAGNPAAHPFQPQGGPQQPNNIPFLPPTEGLGERQRHAHDLIVTLEQDKKLLLEHRKATAAKLKRLQAELDYLEDSQHGQENLRFIYPYQAELGETQRAHDGYGREWNKVEELLELCWAELMVPHDTS